jgi:putative FmdB family regulatory protein
MPIYEYTCTECSNQFEKFVRSMNSTVEVKCPECGGDHVKKGWSAFATSAPSGGYDASAAAAAAACSPGGT